MSEPGRLVDQPAYVGKHLTRSVDNRLLQGRGSYVADLRLPRMVEMTIVRSQLAHARITNIDLSEVSAMDGIHAVVTAQELTDLSPFPSFLTTTKPLSIFPLAKDRVRYVGAPIVAVVADDRYLGEDAAERVHVDFEELPVLASMDAALASDAPRLYDGWPDNKLTEVIAADPAVDQILQGATVVRETYSIQRHAGVPLETRGSVAEFRDGRLTLWATTQHPHMLRTTLSHMLPLRETDIRVIAPDVGGGFGSKQSVYPEDVLVCWLAMRLGRPVRFIEDRTEHLVSTTHAREEVIQIEGAIDGEGRIQADRKSVV